MKTGEKGIALIKEFEGCKFTAYADGAGVWTLGHGHTGGVKDGDTCDQAQADAWLVADVATAERCVSQACAVLTQNQFDALVSFTYNLGCGNLRASTLLKLVNAGSTELAADEFPKWNLVAGKPSDGLTRRRNAERELFLTPEAIIT